MKKPSFKPASIEDIRNRANEAIQAWVRNFEARTDVTKDSDGYYDVAGDVDLSEDPIFETLGLNHTHFEKIMRFKNVGGNYKARAAEFFRLIPSQVKGDAHMVGNFTKEVLRVGCDVGGRTIVTVVSW